MGEGSLFNQTIFEMKQELENNSEAGRFLREPTSLVFFLYAGLFQTVNN